MSMRDNVLRTIRFERPDHIPMRFTINDACWYHYPQEQLESLMAGHPRIFPDYQTLSADFKPALGPRAHADAPFTDDWGCVWVTTEQGITGTVQHHPLADWAALDHFHPPNPKNCDGNGPIDWSGMSERLEAAKKRDDFAVGALRHGHTFLQLCDLRGYQNLMLDMVNEEPRLDRLIEMVEEFNLGLVLGYLAHGVEIMKYPEDLGMQVGPMLRPEHFQRYIKPSYRTLIRPAREAGAIVHMHSDGDIRQFSEDLIDVGVNVLNLQDHVNGIDCIARHLAGRVCIELDIDRQHITQSGTPAQIDALIREEVEKLSRPEGGLMMIYGLYPGVPMENAEAVLGAMERYMGHHC